MRPSLVNFNAMRIICVASCRALKRAYTGVEKCVKTYEATIWYWAEVKYGIFQKMVDRIFFCQLYFEIKVGGCASRAGLSVRLML